MGITQLSVVKALPYIASNVMSLFTVLPLAIVVIAFVNLAKDLLNNRFLLEAGTVSYEIYLVHAFTLGFVEKSLLWICVFIVMTITLAVILHLGQKKLTKRGT